MVKNNKKIEKVLPKDGIFQISEHQSSLMVHCNWKCGSQKSSKSIQQGSLGLPKAGS